MIFAFYFIFLVYQPCSYRFLIASAIFCLTEIMAIVIQGAIQLRMAI